MRGQSKDSPEQRVRLAEDAMTVVNEHPNKSIRMLYAGEVAAELAMPVNDMVRLAERGTRRPAIQVQSRRRGAPMENAEFAALVLLVQEWDSIAEWLIEALFDDDANRMAFLALAEAGGLHEALEVAAPAAREVLERAAVADLELDAAVEAQSLIAAATRREMRQRTSLVDHVSLEEDRAAKLDLMVLGEADPVRALAAAESLLGWLHRRSSERSEGDGA
jgi:DNA primase